MSVSNKMLSLLGESYGTRSEKFTDPETLAKALEAHADRDEQHLKKLLPMVKFLEVFEKQLEKAKEDSDKALKHIEGSDYGYDDRELSAHLRFLVSGEPLEGVDVETSAILYDGEFNGPVDVGNSDLTSDVEKVNKLLSDAEYKINSLVEEIKKDHERLMKHVAWTKRVAKQIAGLTK